MSTKNFKSCIISTFYVFIFHFLETILKKYEISKMHNCAGCGLPIDDKFLFKSSDNMEWHMKCLRCNVCHIPLTELGTDTCFIKDLIPYCREHYQT